MGNKLEKLRGQRKKEFCMQRDIQRDRDIYIGKWSDSREET